jgi:hypothetical protein
MVVPLAGRAVAAVVGGLLVLAAVSSVTATLIVSRPVNSRLTRWVDQMVGWAYHQLVGHVSDHYRWDRIRATQAAAILLAQLAAWLIVAYVGFALLLWPFAARGAESHTTYPVLVRFRSPGPLSSWVTALLAVLDSAALFLALSPRAAPEVPARLCLRGGFRCFHRIARTIGFDIPDEPGPDAGTSVTYAEFLEAVARMREVGFPIERDPAEAWPDFVGWRVNYEAAAYAVADAVYAVPALWSGPRRHPVSPIPPIRPGPGRPPR